VAALPQQVHDAVAADEVQGVLDRLNVELVLTAHPTEARRRTVLVALRRVFALIDQLDDQRITPDEDAEIRRRLEAANRCLAAALQRMARVRRDPTNREVAGALGIPKGTVDCGLFQLKHRLATVYDPDRERTA